MICLVCGGSMVGDGITVVFHCENIDIADINDIEPDANPIYCDYLQQYN